jgi:hypothetical protein
MMFRKLAVKPETDEDGAYPVWVKKQIYEKKRFTERTDNGGDGRPVVFEMPQSWMMTTILLLYIYVGAVSLTSALILTTFLR